MFCSVFCSAIPFLLFVSWTWWVCYPRGILPGTRTLRSRSKYTDLARLRSSSCTLASSAVGWSTYSSAPLSSTSCTVKAPCSPRPSSLHENCTSVTWRTLICPSVRCSATDTPSVSCVRCGLYALSDLFLTAPGELLVVELHRVLDGLHGFFRAGEVLDVYLLVLQLLVVFEEAPKLVESVLGQLVVALVGAVLRVFQGDADDLLVVLAVVHHVHHPYGPHGEQAQRVHGLLHEDEHVERVAVIA